MPHVKPTSEELEAKAQEALKELENMSEEEKNANTPEEEEKDAELKEDAEKDDKPAEPKAKDEPAPEKSEKPPQKDSESEPEDLKKKLTASTREAQILFARNKKVEEAIVKAGELPPPTDEEIAKKYTDWDDLSEFEKRMIRETETLNRRFNMVTSVTSEFKEIDAWQEKIDKYLSDPKVLIDHPELEGKEDEFKHFASKPTRRGVDFEDITRSFLYDIDAVRPHHKGSSMDTKSDGVSRTSPEDNKLSLDDARRLRISNYSEYVKALKAGRIASDF